MGYRGFTVIVLALTVALVLILPVIGAFITGRTISEHGAEAMRLTLATIIGGLLREIAGKP